MNELDSNRMLDEAIDLLIRLENDPSNPVSIDMVRQWRARSPQHERVWARVVDAHGMTGKLLKDQEKVERRQKLGLTRRNLIVAGASGLGVAAAGSLLGPQVMVWAKADHITAKGEVRRVALADGSIATLGPDSAIAIDYLAARRRIELLQGMSFFEVAADPGRPFVVEVGRLAATALGTAFDISNDAGFVTVSVAQGRVTAGPVGVDRATGRQLAAGDWITYGQGLESIDRGRRDAAQIAAWRSNTIIAEQEPVSALVARISRWYPGRVIMADPSLGAQRVSGVFDLRNPQRALEAVVHPAGGRVRQMTSLLTVISPL